MVEIILLAIFTFCIFDFELYKRHISNFIWSSHKEIDPILRVLPGSGFYVWWETRAIYKLIDKTKKENEK